MPAVPCRQKQPLWGGSCQCLSQHPQHSSRAGGAARSAPGVAARYPHTKSSLVQPLSGLPQVRSSALQQMVGQPAVGINAALRGALPPCKQQAGTQ